MAIDIDTIVRQGDLAWGELPGRKGSWYDADGLKNIETSYSCREDEIEISIPAIGDEHPDDPTLFVVDVIPVYGPGGQTETRIIYKGGAANEDGIILRPGVAVPIRAGNSTTKTLTVKGIQKWKSPPPMISITGEVETSFNIRFRGDSVSYKYGRTGFSFVRAWEALAETDLPLEVVIISKSPSESVDSILRTNAKIVTQKKENPSSLGTFIYIHIAPDGTEYVSSGIGDPEDYAGWIIRDEVIRYGIDDGFTLETIEMQRISSLQTDELCPGLYRISETWEIEGVPDDGIVEEEE